MKQSIKKLFLFLFFSTLIFGYVYSQEAKKPVSPQITLGWYDGVSYTSAYGDFSIFLKDWTKVESIADAEENKGSNHVLKFEDKDKNEYSITLSRLSEKADVHELLTKLLTEGKAKGRNVNLTNIGNIEFFSWQILEKMEKEKKWRASSNILFVKNTIIYNIIIKTTPTSSPVKASQLLQHKVNELCENAVFRGRVATMDPDLNNFRDPRFSIISGCAKKVAHELGYDFDLDIRKKVIMHINSKQDKVSISIGLIDNGKNIAITKSVACPDSASKKAKLMQEKYFKALIKSLMNEEKLNITQSDEFDSDLLNVMVS